MEPAGHVVGQTQATEFHPHGQLVLAEVLRLGGDGQVGGDEHLLWRVDDSPRFWGELHRPLFEHAAELTGLECMFDNG